MLDRPLLAHLACASGSSSPDTLGNTFGMSLDSIRALIKTDLAATHDHICNELLSDIPLIKQLAQHILSSGGKRIRPIVVLLAAKACQYDAKQHVPLAAAIELIHTATLLHDDIVDASTLRRGNPTANHLFGNEASVLVGDFLYSRAFQLILTLGYPDISLLFANATSLIAEGELLQLAHCNDPDVTEAYCFDVIHRKTAKLFEIAAEAGAILSNPDTQCIRALKNYGIHLGTAYQLIDDALDYESSAHEMGKNAGDDLAEGKPTLPLIYAMKHASKKEVDLLRDAIYKGSRKNFDVILGIIESTGAIEYTASAAELEIKKAIKCLDFLPDSPWRNALHELADFVITRNS